MDIITSDPHNSIAEQLQKQSLCAKLCACLSSLPPSKKRRVKNKGALSEFIEGADPRTRPVNIPELSPEEKRIKTLVLDLDETLVTSSLSDIPSADLKVKIQVSPNHQKNISVKFRPGVRPFLREIAEFYEIIIFSSSTREYANVVIDFLDTLGCVGIRLFRENCSIATSNAGNETFKDISTLNRSLGSVIIVDNDSRQFRKQPENGIEIKAFDYDKQDDDVLIRLLPFLRFMSGVKDVRPVNYYMREFYGRREIIYLDVNNMESTYQWGKVIGQEDRLPTERSTDSKATETLDWSFGDDDDDEEENQKDRENLIEELDEKMLEGVELELRQEAHSSKRNANDKDNNVNLYVKRHNDFEFERRNVKVQEEPNDLKLSKTYEQTLKEPIKTTNGDMQNPKKVPSKYQNRHRKQQSKDKHACGMFMAGSDTMIQNGIDCEVSNNQGHHQVEGSELALCSHLEQTGDHDGLSNINNNHNQSEIAAVSVNTFSAQTLHADNNSSSILEKQHSPDFRQSASFLPSPSHNLQQLL